MRQVDEDVVRDVPGLARPAVLVERKNKVEKLDGHGSGTNQDVALTRDGDGAAFGVLVAISMGILFLGGVNGRLFTGITAALASVFVLVIWLSPWRRERIFAYLDPWSENNALGKAYQLSHSLIAFGRGEWFDHLRVGLDAYLSSTQEHVTGTVRVKLFKGVSHIIGRTLTS